MRITLQEESVGVDMDIQKEYSRQREHLERSVASLRKKLAKDTEIHRADNVRIMQVITCNKLVKEPFCQPTAKSSLHIFFYQMKFNLLNKTLHYLMLQVQSGI